MKMRMKKFFTKIRFLDTFLTAIIIVGITTLLFLYTSGYRLSKGKEKVVDLNKTGMISAKSIPAPPYIWTARSLPQQTIP
jgi:hypothetical protein